MRILPRTAESGSYAALAGLAPKRRPSLTPYYFILPYLVFFVLFRLGPSLAGLGIAFTNWQAVGTPRFVGFANFQAMARDPRLGDAFQNTVFFVLLTVPTLIVLSLALALFLNQPRRGRAVGRVVVFMPYVIMSTVVGVLWTWILDKDFGLLNVYLNFFGIANVPWLVSESTAMYGIILTTVWWTVGYDMVLFLAGLQDIPHELYEAARIDGARAWGVFRFVTLPLLAPTTFLVLMLTIINSFQVFDQVYVMTSGGPGTATLTLVQYIYTTSFQFQKFGYGSAVALILFGILVIVAFFQIRGYRRGLKGVE
ncbi:MAG: sugar ABC transporter permease [Chloroflexota bacterium]|jgi:multiple sugar transport system permease protein|nr:MAG: sugar ABC transporter permease [Chloroflexota bacterium]